jgi:REP element-mobilizing transposase RayT
MLFLPPAVSQPRQILPEATYLITRRTIFRHMLLRPDQRMTQMLLYLLALFARRDHLQVHAFCAMSTHLHIILTDVDGNLPRFLHSFHRMVALCTKALRRWPHVVWDKSSTSVVRLETPAAVVEKIAYVLANPVTARLVRGAHQWPGAKVLAGEIGSGEIGADRPRVYLNPENPRWPERASLPITLPPGLDADAVAVFHRQVAAEIARVEQRVEAEMREQGRSFPNARDLCTVPPQTRVKSVEPAADRNPTFAPGRGQVDAARSAVSALRTFRSLYRQALARWQDLERDVVFPAGTWWMRVFHGAVVPSRGPGVPTDPPTEVEASPAPATSRASPPGEAGQHPQAHRAALLDVELRPHDVVAGQHGAEGDAAVLGDPHGHGRVVRDHVVRVHEVDVGPAWQASDHGMRSLEANLVPPDLRDRAGAVREAADPALEPTQAGDVALLAVLEEDLVPHADAQEGDARAEDPLLQGRHQPALPQRVHGGPGRAHPWQDEARGPRDLGGRGDQRAGDAQVTQGVADAGGVATVVVDDADHDIDASGRRGRTWTPAAVRADLSSGTE